MKVPASRYPALERWAEADRAGHGYPVEHPVSQAARHEANARQYDELADHDWPTRAAATWRTVAVQEMVTARGILAAAYRRVAVDVIAVRPHG